MLVLSKAQRMTLGHWLKWHRLNGPKKYRVQRVAASKCGVSAQYLGRIEKGGCGPSVSLLKRLRRLYKIPQRAMIDIVVEIYVDEIDNQLR